MNPDQNNTEPANSSSKPKSQEANQEKSDPQKTELKGFIDPKHDLEPTLQDGTKSPDK